MSSYYLDSSLTVKYYVSEPQSEWVEELVRARTPEGRPEHSIAFSQIGLVEVAAALAKKGRMTRVAPERQMQLYGALLRDCRDHFSLVKVSEALIHAAAELTQRRPLRGYDAVHLASALTLHRQLVAAGLPPLVFGSGDKVLCDAAAAEGLRTVNPNEPMV